MNGIQSVMRVNSNQKNRNENDENVITMIVTI